ncbi:Bor family protein [Leptospira kirschneri]|nr:Bor family protein [Leptospira kirschneri]
MVPAYEKRHHFVLFGVGQTKEISASQICDSRPVAKIESSFTFVDILLSMVT